METKEATKIVKALQEGPIAQPPAEEPKPEFERLLEMPPAWNELNDAVSGFNPKLLAGHKQIEITYAMTTAVQKMRALMTTEVMAPIMALMNTEVGFLTDRGPNSTKNKTPYDEKTVKDAVVAGFLNGLWPIGNQINIIKSRLYITQIGYLYQMNHVPGMSDIKTIIDPPTKNPSGAYIVSLCTWKMNGSADEFHQKFHMPIDQYTTSDQLVGKSRRKILKLSYQHVTGGRLMGIMPDRDDIMPPPPPDVPPEYIANDEYETLKRKFSESKPPVSQTAPPAANHIDPLRHAATRLPSQDEPVERIDLMDVNSPRNQAMDELLMAYGEAHAVEPDVASSALREYVKTTLGFKTMGPCQLSDFTEMSRRVALGPFDPETIPPPADILKENPKPAAKQQKDPK